MAEVAQAVEPAPKNTAQLFRYSTWVHIGAGAEQCSEVSENAVECTNPLHFHAWCRLPNQFQHREIRERALAARARRMRQLRDLDSDTRTVLDDEIETILRSPDASDVLVEELVNADWWKDYMVAVRELHEFVDEHDERPWQTIDRDRVRFGELQASEDRPKEEYAELEVHLLAYSAALSEAHEAILAPRRTALQARDVNALADLVRDQRIDAEAQADFMQTYSSWEWYAGTLTAPNGERRFQSMQQMRAAAPEVIGALQATFDDLERTFDDGPTKNS